MKIVIVLCFSLLLFQSNTLKAQVLNNNGAVISVTAGVVLQGDTLENTATGNIKNNGTIGLRGHYINVGTTEGNGIYNIQGNWTNTGTFNADASTVNFIGSNNQIITSTGGELFFDLTINNSGASSVTNRIILLNNVNISNNLTIAQGNVETGANTLYLTNPLTTSLDYTSVTGSRVIGKFERGINAADNYLFPIGSDDNYNPMNLSFNAIQSAGSVLSEFISSDPDSIGLPLPDPGYLNPADSVEVYDADSTGYWSVTANGFASDDFDVNLDGTGFTVPDQNVTRIIKRPNGGDWTLDGKHKDAISPVAYRNTLIGGVAGTGHHFGWGHIRPRIQTQPADTAICDGESATFSIVATGRGTLTYEWQVLELSGGWQDITDDAIYDNSDTDTLLIMAADTSMNGYKYRVTVFDSLGNFHRSNAQATLTVNPRPEATATPQMDTICNGETTHIVLTSTVPGTSFALTVLYDGSGFGANTTLDGDTIKQTLNNLTLFADSVVYRIFPTGPGSTSCGGTADTVIIWVEPTVEINAVSDTICNGDATNIMVTSPNTTTNGIRYTWTVADNPNITGESNSTGNGQDIDTAIEQNLTNTSLTKQLVQYVITPWTVNASDNNECTDVGEVITIDIWIEPTVEINAVNDTICDGDNTNIMVTSPNTTTNGIRYTWTVADNPNITGESNSIGNGQNISTAIIQTLDNVSDSKQLVQYVITPWTVNASDYNECTDAGEVITIDIWINPTPRLITTILRDTICNDTRTHITLTTPTVLTDGIVTFDYTSIADAGLTGNSSANDLIHDDIIEDLLHNNTAYPAYPLVVRYTIIPRTLSTGCAYGPIVTDSITVHPTADTDMFTDSVICYMESNGTASVVAENGHNIFTYEWNDPLNQIDSLATGLPIGWYTVTVTDNQACTKIDSVLIEQPYRLIPVIDTVKNVSCFGVGDGYIVLDPTGGNATYSYSWLPTGETTDSIGGLDGALYYVTVTDWKGCAQDTVIEVGEPPQGSIFVDPIHVSCNGENDGSAEAVTVGPYTYLWSPTGETTAIINNLSPGPYSVIATNAEGCEYKGSITITEPDSLLVDSIIPTRISCAGDADGTIDLFISGGNTEIPYTYNWFSSDGTGHVTDIEDQTGLSGGMYYVTINDWRNCEITDSAYINEPPFYSSSITSNDVTCNGDENGEIDLTVIGGNTEEPYTFNWTTPDGTGHVTDIEDQTGLSGGSYYVIITDAKDCELYDSAIIAEPDLLETFIYETNVTCFGYDDGTAKLDILGGSGGYIISWDPPGGETADSIYGLSAGTYYVTVTDGNACLSTNYVEITEPEQIDNNETFENITCFGYSNGKIIITPTGGTLPYNYLWSHSTVFTDSLAENLDAGNYSVSVIDGNNCVEISSIDITQPDPLVFDLFIKDDITCYGDEDGYISFNMFGGTPDYTYTWSNGYTETSVDMLSEGLYSINVTDIHNCEIDTTVEIVEPEKLIIVPVLRMPTCPDIQDGYIELNIAGGRLPYIIYWDNGSFEEDLYEIRSGIYDVLINDSSLCEIDTSFIVRSAHDFCIKIPSAFTPNADNINDKWEIGMRGLYPNAEIEIFNRWGKRIFFSKGYEESQYWDGTLNGKELPMDAYYYIINLKNGSKRISGTITLIR